MFKKESCLTYFYELLIYADVEFSLKILKNLILTWLIIELQNFRNKVKIIYSNIFNWKTKNHKSKEDIFLAKEIISRFSDIPCHW